MKNDLRCERLTFVADHESRIAGETDAKEAIPRVVVAVEPGVPSVLQELDEEAAPVCGFRLKPISRFGVFDHPAEGGSRAVT